MEERFKSVLVERATALKTWRYISTSILLERRSVTRQNNYKWSSFAEWKTSGKHPFQQAFSKHFKKLLAENDEGISGKDDLLEAYEKAINLRLEKDQKSKSEILSMERQLYSNAFAVGSVEFRKSC